MFSRSEVYTKNLLKVVVAQICQICGWNSIHNSSLEILVNCLDKFMQEISKQTHRISEHYNRTEPNLDDLALAFQYLNVNLSEIKEYVDYVSPVEKPLIVPRYPVVVQTNTVGNSLEEPSTSNANADGESESENEEDIIRGLFSFNREYSTDANGEGVVDKVEVKKENEIKSPELERSNSLNSINEKSDSSKKNPNSLNKSRQLAAVTLSSTGTIQGTREGRLPTAELPLSFILNEEPDPIPEKPSRIKETKSYQEPGPSKKDKLSQEPDKVKLNIFKKISQPHKNNNSTVTQNNPPPIPPPVVVPPSNPTIEIFDSPPHPEPVAPPPPKKERRPRKPKPPPPSAMPLPVPEPKEVPFVLPPNLNPALEVIPIKRENPPMPNFPQIPEMPPMMQPPFGMYPKSEQDLQQLFGVPKFFLPQAPGLIPTMNSQLFNQGPTPGPSNLFLPRMPPAFNPPPHISIDPVPKREKEKEHRKSATLCNVPPLVPPNLFMDQGPVDFSKTAPKSPPVVVPPPPAPVEPDLEKLAALKKEQKQKKKEQKRLEKQKLQNQLLMNTMGDGKGDVVLILDDKKASSSSSEKPLKLDKKLEKMMLKKLMKKKKSGTEMSELLSGIDEQQQRKLEKKLKKMESKSNKAAQKMEMEAVASCSSLDKDVKPMPEAVSALPKLTLKIHSPQLPDTHSRDAEAGFSKDYQRISEMEPVPKKLKLTDPLPPIMPLSDVDCGGEPELAKISPLITRPMKQQVMSLMNDASPAPTRGRPRGSGPKQQQQMQQQMKDESYGSQVWICPACGRVDDGSPMIGCDGCDAWYHWVCVGIKVPPGKEDWYCRVCIMQKKEQQADGLSIDLAAKKKEKKRKKKEKRSKMDDSD